MKTLVIHPSKTEAKRLRDMLDTQATTEATSEADAMAALLKPAHGLEVAILSPGEMGPGVIERMARLGVPVLVVCDESEPPYHAMAVANNAAGFIYRRDLDTGTLKDACDKAVKRDKAKKGIA